MCRRDSILALVYVLGLAEGKARERVIGLEGKGKERAEVGVKGEAWLLCWLIEAG